MPVLLSALVFPGCARPPHQEYYTAYKVHGVSGELREDSAERAQIAAANTVIQAQSVGKFDRPARLVRAPQPVMSVEDIRARVFGTVVVDIYFNEEGFVDHTVIVQSAKDSLSAAVLSAVSRWKVVPPWLNGHATKCTIQQVFTFKTGRA